MNLEAVQKLIDSGATQKQIASEFNTNYECVRKFLKRHGLRTTYSISHEAVIAAQTASRGERMGWAEKRIPMRDCTPADWGMFEDVERLFLKIEERTWGWLRMPPKPDFGGYMSPLCAK